jgi:hypothetical protein
VELLGESVSASGFRWAHNLRPYAAEEPQRMVRYYEEVARRSAVVLARAEATR